jgi:hypothetical protein
MMTNDVYNLLLERFREVFAAKWDRSELSNYDDLKEKFAFHMADVATHLQDLAQAYEGTSPCDNKELGERTEMFFFHCLPHLMAAAQIYDEIPQIFAEQKGVHDWGRFVDEALAQKTLSRPGQGQVESPVRTGAGG